VLQYDKYWKAGAFGDHIGTGPNLRETFKRCGYYMKPFTTKKNNTIRSDYVHFCLTVFDGIFVYIQYIYRNLFSSYSSVPPSLDW
jgi:hypothetical protein